MANYEYRSDMIVFSESIRLGELSEDDPAETLLNVKICDPAMGSGHFLVSLVDYLTDRVISAMVDVEGEVAFGDYVSPLGARIRAIRTRILKNAGEKGWTVAYDQLDDRHIVRRMVLKRCIYGVDKNPMVVELAKVALWLHTFTVGAPLSFMICAAATACSGPGCARGSTARPRSAPRSFCTSR